jgi:hypothetical protein
MRELPTTNVRGELALDVARQAASLAIGIAQLGDHRLRVAGDELVQHRVLGRAPPVTDERLSGRPGRSFVEATREHARAL